MYLHSKQFVELPVICAVVTYGVANAFGLQPTCHDFCDFCGKVGGEQLTLEVKAMRLRHKALKVRDSLLDLAHCSSHCVRATECAIMGEVGAVESRVPESTCHLSRTVTVKPRRPAGGQDEPMTVWGAAMGIADPQAAANESEPATAGATVLRSGAYHT